MFAMATIIFAQVISRYVVGKPFTWSEELGRYIFVWMSFLGMAVAVKEGSHVALDVILQKLSGYKKKILITINNVMVLLFGVIVTYSGIRLFYIGIGQSSPTLRIPMQYIYLVIPISGILLIYFVINDFVAQIKDVKEVQ